MEVALEGEQWGEGHGVFTHYLIDGIKGEADGYGGGEEDGIISIGELFDYVSDKVREATNNKQHPLIGSKWYDRDLPLVYVESLKEEKFVELLSEIVSQTSKQNYSEVISLSETAIKLNPKKHLSYFYRGQL